MISISNLRIDPRSLGEGLLLTDVTPYYDYSADKKDRALAGYKYKIACPIHKLESITVKIAGAKQMEPEEGAFPIVKFSGMEIKAYIIDGKPVISATATGIHTADKG